jgi:acetyl esterase
VPDNYPTIPDERSRIFNELYIGGKEIGASPYASPLLAADCLLGLLPETLLIVGGMDPFQFDAQTFTNRMSNAGGKAILKIVEHSRHGFIINCMDEWEDAQRIVIENILT